MRVLLLWADGGSANLGVRALAAGHRALVHRHWPGAEIVEHNYGAHATPIRMGSVRGAARELLLGRGGVVEWLRTFDLVIDTRSGDSFSDLYGLPRHQVMTAMAEAVRRSGTPYVLGPQTYGPYLSRRSAWLAKWSLRHADLVLARDPESAAVLERLGRPADLLTTDVVFAIPQPARSPGTPQADVMLNVSGLLWNGQAGADAQRYRGIVVSLIEALAASGRDITLLAHVLGGSPTDSDVDILDEVQRTAGRELRTFVPTSLDDARAALAASSLTIGSRMHACLNSLSVGVPAIPLAYSRKFEPLLKDVGWPYTVGLRESDDPVADVVRLIDRPELRSAVPGVLDSAAQKLDSAERLLGSAVPAVEARR